MNSYMDSGSCAQPLRYQHAMLQPHLNKILEENKLLYEFYSRQYKMDCENNTHATKKKM